MEERKISMEEQKKEAIVRMDLLGINSRSVEVYDNCDIIPFFITGTEETLLGVSHYEHELICTFEEDCNALVYCIVYCESPFGKMVSLLFVSDELGEWAMDRNGIKNGHVMAWVENLNHPQYSEFGMIAVRTTKEGALDRVG